MEAEAEDDALDLAILEAQREEAAEKQIIRELLVSRREGPCGHVVQIAPKWMKGTTSCGCCGITDVSFCCRNLGSCEFRGCRRCVVGDLKQQRKNDIKEQRKSLKAAVDAARRGRAPCLGVNRGPGSLSAAHHRV